MLSVEFEGEVEILCVLLEPARSIMPLLLLLLRLRLLLLLRLLLISMTSFSSLAVLANSDTANS